MAVVPKPTAVPKPIVVQKLRILARKLRTVVQRTRMLVQRMCKREVRRGTAKPSPGTPTRMKCKLFF